MKNRHVVVLFLAQLVLSFPSTAATPARQAEIAERGKSVMPFDLSKTTHVFQKTNTGGIQKVVVKDTSDATQIKLIRQHLVELKSRFSRGDFNSPTDIHGPDMPGLATLKSAKPGDIRVTYKPLRNGAQLAYVTRKSKFRNALHEWFDAQLADHGHDAMRGDEAMHHDMHADHGMR